MKKLIPFLFLVCPSIAFGYPVESVPSVSDLKLLAGNQHSYIHVVAPSADYTWDSSSTVDCDESQTPVAVCQDASPSVGRWLINRPNTVYFNSDNNIITVGNDGFLTFEKNAGTTNVARIHNKGPSPTDSALTFNDNTDNGVNEDGCERSAIGYHNDPVYSYAFVEASGCPNLYPTTIDTPPPDWILRQTGDIDDIYAGRIRVLMSHDGTIQVFDSTGDGTTEGTITAVFPRYADTGVLFPGKVRIGGNNLFGESFTVIGSSNIAATIQGISEGNGLFIHMAGDRSDDLTWSGLNIFDDYDTYFSVRANGLVYTKKGYSFFDDDSSDIGSSSKQARNLYVGTGIYVGNELGESIHCTVPPTDMTFRSGVLVHHSGGTCSTYP